MHAAQSSARERPDASDGGACKVVSGYKQAPRDLRPRKLARQVAADDGAAQEGRRLSLVVGRGNSRSLELGGWTRAHCVIAAKVGPPTAAAASNDFRLDQRNELLAARDESKNKKSKTTTTTSG